MDAKCDNWNVCLEIKEQHTPTTKKSGIMAETLMVKDKNGYDRKIGQGVHLYCLFAIIHCLGLDAICVQHVQKHHSVDIIVISNQHRYHSVSLIVISNQHRYLSSVTCCNTVARRDRCRAGI